MFVSLSATPVAPGLLAELAVASPAHDVDSALALALRLGAETPMPGEGWTRDLWETLATLAANDLGVARAVEPHLDAIAILAQAGLDSAGGSWGVFAAEGGDAPLTLGADGTLSGTKLWCSLADRLDSALVTASGALYSVDLHHPGVRVERDAWVARGLTEIPSGPVHFDAVPATPVGAPGWYLTRPGFAWGGIGVAACWYGGAVGIARTVFAAALARPEPFLLAHLGAIDELLQSSRRALAEAASLIDDGGGDKALAKRARATVARACEEIIDRSGHALGPAPLALDAGHAKRVADLQLYVRQHHAEKDQASLGESLAAGSLPW